MSTAEIRTAIERAIPIALPIAKTAGTWGAATSIGFFALSLFTNSNGFTEQLKNSLHTGTSVSFGAAIFQIAAPYGKTASAISGFAAAFIAFKGIEYVRENGILATIKAVLVPVVLVGGAAAYKYRTELSAMIADFRK